MKSCITLFMTIQLSITVLSQTSVPTSTIISKSVIDSAAVANWADLLWSQPRISDNGRYFIYPVDNLPVGSKSLFIQSTENGWKKQFVGVENGYFSGDSKLAVFQSGDTLYTVTLGRDKLLMVPGIISYKNPNAGEGRWLAYQLKTKELVVQDLFSGKEEHHRDVVSYQFDNSGTALLLKSTGEKEGSSSEQVEVIDLSSGKVYPVWQSADSKKLSASRFSFDQSGRQVVFMVEDKSTTPASNQVWYYREGMDKAVVKLTSQTQGIDSGMMISSSPYFSRNGKYIFFKIKPVPVSLPKPDPNLVPVDVWSYKDDINQNIQLANLKLGDDKFELKTELTAALVIESNKIIPLEKKGMVNELYEGPGDYVLLANRKYVGDKNWIKDSIKYFLISLRDDNEKLFTTGMLAEFSFSSNGSYLAYYDCKMNNYFSYNFSTNQVTEISSKIPEPLTTIDDLGSKYMSTLVGIACWLKDDQILIYDNYDLWKVNVNGKEKPINLTNAYGKSHHVKFRLLNRINIINATTYSANMPLLLTSFNSDVKANGIYQILPNQSKDPEKLCSGPSVIWTKSQQTDRDLMGMEPVKAKNAGVWIVRKHSETEAPNFFVTKDFKSYKQLTNIQPQEKYNWYTTELITWKLPDDQPCQGILYKPENFDSSKKYPVIVHYYEKRSDQLHEFIRPDFTGGDIDIPWFVSQGYIVFVPDIYYTIGKTGESVVNSVVPGVRTIFKRKYIDSTKIAIQGHSFGGYETNYLITHTNIFAAAIESAGASDFISDYGTLLPDGAVNEGYKNIHYDANGQYRTQTTMWKNLNVYIDNSPLFSADKVTTPLLIMHNKKDFLVPWEQAVEFFIALRRLNKTVWMLQYDNGGHSVYRKSDKIDYTKRITQFLDHNLKGKYAPMWMTKGVPANLKGLESGFPLDPTGKCNGHCKICNNYHSKN